MQSCAGHSFVIVIGNDVQVHFGTIPAETVTSLLTEELTYKCAGGLMIEHPLVSPLITRLVGTEDSVKGLSKHLVKTLMLKL